MGMEDRVSKNRNEESDEAKMLEGEKCCCCCEMKAVATVARAPKPDPEWKTPRKWKLSIMEFDAGILPR